MKTTFLLFGIWIIAINVNSQDYNRLIQQNKYWDQYSFNNFFYDYVNRVFFTGVDTVIAGKVYSVSNQYPFQSVSGGSLTPPFVIDTVAISTNKYLREDTIEKKVYMYYPDLTPADQLLYDFSLEIGDTLKSEYNAINFNYLIVESIDTVTLLNGETRKRFKLIDPLIPADSGFYTEGIGGIQGLFNFIIPAYYSFPKYGYFCISYNEINLWGDECNWYFVGNQDLPERLTIKLYPNPVREKVIVEVPARTSEYSFNVYATNGKLIKTIRLNSPKCEISLDGISPGIYVVQIASESYFYTGKLTIFN